MNTQEIISAGVKRKYPKPYILTPCSGWRPIKKDCRWGHLDGENHIKMNTVCYGSHGNYVPGNKRNLIPVCVEDL